MADKRISDLNLHTALELSDSLPIINNGETKKTTYGSLYYGIREGLATTGSNIFNGDETISGSLSVSGTTEFGGDLVPKEARGATLGTLERPFSDIFVSSGSINIASDVSGSPNTTLSNVSGNILVSAGGMQLLGSSAFIATTGSFQYISGSMTQIGNYTQLGSHILTGNQTITGSLLISGSTTQIGNNTLTGNTQLYGTIDVSGSTNFHNHTITMTGSMYTSGSQTITGSLDIKGNVNVASGSEFYLAGNKLFNYGVFSDTTTQSGSANTAYSMKLNTIDFAHEVNIVSGSRITPINTGVYNLQFSAQLSNTANTNIGFDIWLDYTGSNVSNSNTQVSLSKGSGQLGKVVASWNWLMPIKANDYVEIRWSCTDSTGQIYAMGTQTNPTRPAIPSVIATLTQIG